MSFAELNLNPAVLRAVADLGFERPTAVQADAIPAVLAGRDVLGCARTGSGKTGAFLLPIINAIADRPRGVTRALVLVPTRELAAQVLQDFRDFARHTAVRAAAIYGGVAPGPQADALRRGTDVVVATPGRLLDHLRNGVGRFDALETLVLDEADRMLDMGFLPDIRRVLQHLPARRQTLFFSATMPPAIRALTRELLTSPVTIEREPPSTTPSAIEQAIYPVAENLKADLLVELLRRGDIRQALVFTRTKHRANRLADRLAAEGIRAARIHGNRSQGQRTQALDDFKAGRLPVLVATDIVARGIDVEALEHVVNFDVPVAAEDYVHRVGRTGRAGATGEAFTLASPGERQLVHAIERALGRKLPRRTLADFDYNAAGRALEVPLAQRIAEIRRRKAEDRARAEARRQRRPAFAGSAAASPAQRTFDGGRPAGRRRRGGRPRVGAAAGHGRS
ncbi:MAG: DEAD/DEAH box helicase [Acidobacteriota bacterium]|nr:MAG: RNA helicase [Acidobacteriota bacterium]